MFVPSPETGIALQIGVSKRAVLIAALLLVLLLSIELIWTMKYSVVRYFQRKLEDRIKQPLREELLTRLYRPSDPEWDQWVESLSGHERPVLESLLDDYLRELEGADAERLTDLGTALGITAQAHRDLKQGSYNDRLHALTWLALLRDAPAIDVLKQHCMDTPRERAAAVRVLDECDYPENETIGVDLLLSDDPDPFSIFGVDTLYKAAEKDPSHLFNRAAEDFTTWEPQLQQQVLLACRHLRTLLGDANVFWLAEALDSPAEQTRVEAAKTLGGFAWHPTLLENIDLQTLASDDSPHVRASAYQMFGEWGDESAIDLLRFDGMTDANDRVRVAAARALVEHSDESSFNIPVEAAAAWSWARAHAAHDAAVRDVSGGVTEASGHS